MKKSRFTTEQIIGFIKQAEAGMAVSELCRKRGFSPASFYQWRAKYAGMEAEDAAAHVTAAPPHRWLSPQVRWSLIAQGPQQECRSDWAPNG